MQALFAVHNLFIYLFDFTALRPAMLSKRLKISFAITLCSLAFLAGCSTGEDLAVTQDAAFRNYLIDRDELEDARELGGTYRVIAENITDGYEVPPQLPVIAEGDTVEILFAMYTFVISNDKGSVGPLIYTNDEELIKSISEKINTEYWLTDLLELEVGAGQVLEAVDAAFAGCRLGDIVNLYIPSGKAFGKNGAGNFPKDTAMFYDMTIVSVNGENIPPDPNAPETPETPETE